MFDFNRKIVAVTGASGGIGKQIAYRFFDAGASVCICSRSKERIDKTAREIGAADPARIFAMAADTSRIAETKAFLQAAIDRFGRIDILVNNAGVQFPKPSVEVTEENWDDTLNTNLRGYFFAAQFAAKDMLGRGAKGVIVNIGSVNAVTVVVGQAVYATTKASISQMTKSLAREWGKAGIRVNCVGPGSIPTLINADIYKDRAVEMAMEEKIPLGRRGTTDEVADATLFLASDFASYITGQTLFVDGGLTLVHG
ncbi:MAG TPA: glucose 1-dehydrogenase [Rectinemataceae bacterium]|nr:glucose 1-dehydrogenase [Rectinemataceae bacterium]